MSQNLESNVWVQIEDYINQIWSFDGFLSPSINSICFFFNPFDQS